MRIAFCSIDALADAVQSFDPDTVLSIWSPRYRVADIPGRVQQDLIMDDVEERSLRTFGRSHPCHEHIERVIQVAGAGARRLLIHCTAGLSRSPAIAIVVAVQTGHSASAACDEVVRLIPHAQPNRLLLQMADDVMGSNDLLPSAMAAFDYQRGRGMPSGDRSGLSELFPQPG
jgi:predicted protein tyrosine phosphatase